MHALGAPSIGVANLLVFHQDLTWICAINHVSCFRERGEARASTQGSSEHHAIGLADDPGTLPPWRHQALQGRGLEGF